MNWGGVSVALGLLVLAVVIGQPWGWLIVAGLVALGVNWRRGK